MSYWLRPEPIGRPPSLTGGGDDSDERAARRTLWLLAASVGMLAVGLVVFVTVQSLRSQGRAPGGESPVITTPEDAARVIRGIGPAPGTELAAYVDARRQALASAAGPRVAVVSLTGYTTEARARAAVASAEVLALIAAAPGGQPAVVTGDLRTWVQGQTAEARAEREEIRKLIPTVDDPAFKRFYQAELDRLDALISSIRPTGDLAFAVVVRADAPTLRDLAARAEVRLVDVGPDAEPRAASEYRGLRPEETRTANDPNVRPT